jgi:hypothetical protein
MSFRFSLRGAALVALGVMALLAAPHEATAQIKDNSGVASYLTGSLGIGTATPQSLLHVYGGEVQVGSSGASCVTANNGAIRFSGSTLYYCTGTTWTSLGGGGGGGGTPGGANTQVQFNNSGAFGGSSNFVWDNTNGRVGIGTTGPAYALDVNGVIVQRPAAAANMNNYIQANAAQAQSTTNLNPGVTVWSGSGYRYGMDLGYVGSRYRTRLFAPGIAAGNADIGFGFHTAGTDPTAQSSFTEAMTIRGDTGNVGIGTTAPGYLLTINGPNASASGPHTAVYTSADTTYPVFQQLNWAHDNVSLNFDTVYNGGAAFISSSNTNNFQIYKRSGLLEFNYAQAVAAGSNISWNNGITLDSYGDVSIGGTSPILSLEVDHADSTTGGATAGVVGGASWLYLWTANTVYGPAVIWDNSNDLRFIPQSSIGGSGSEKMRITASGNVGIGTTGPGATLDVLGPNSSTDLSVRSSSGQIQFYAYSTPANYIESTNAAGTASELLVFTGNAGGTGTFSFSGNVGIGTTAPSASLQVGSRSSNVNGNNSTVGSFGASSAGGIAYPLTLANTATGAVANETQLTFTDASTWGATGAIGSVVTNAGNAASDLRFLTYTGSALSEFMRIQGSTGNVGIGTTSPATLLHVNGVETVGLNGGTGGQITLNGATSGSVALEVAAAAGTGTVFQLPATNGTNGYVLQTNGSGVTSWAAAGSTALSSITAASTGHTIANANNAQVWNWDTLTTGIGLTMGSTSMTTGSLLKIANTHTSGQSYPLYVTTTSTATYADAILGQALGTTGDTVGVEGDTASTSAGSAGVLGDAYAGSGATYGVYGYDMSSTGYGGYFTNVSTGYALATGGGNVGIGTMSPTNLLSLSGSASQTFWMERNPTAATAGNGLTVEAGGAYSGGTNLNGGTLTMASGVSTGTGSSSIQFQTFPAGSTGTTDNTATTAMTILGSGYVGIGTTAPGTPLEVSNSTTGYAISRITNPSTSVTTGAGGSQLNFATHSTDGITQNLANIKAVKQGSYSAGSAGTYLADLAFETNSSAGAIEQMRITSAGNVGIGTTAPDALLSLGGSAAQTIDMVRNPTSATAGNGLTVQAGGAYSGGTDLAGGNLTLTSGISTGTGSSSIQFQTFPAGSSGTSDNTATTAMTILGNGNVGIGTASPNAALDVNSTSIIIEQSHTPSHTATCTAGTMWWDTGYIYVCTASGTVKRAALSTF